jgi:hypothetical protein
MKLRCDHCSISFDESALEAGGRRCPKCLRKSTVRELDGVASGPRRPWARATFALVLGVAFLVPGAIVLPEEGQYLMVGERVRGSVISTHMRGGNAARCDVRYSFDHHGDRVADDGSTVFACPHGFVDVDVIAGPPVRSRIAGAGTWLSWVGLLVISLTGFMMLLVAAHVFFPDVAWIRDLAAVLGSKDARARAEVERGASRGPREF